MIDPFALPKAELHLHIEGTRDFYDLTRAYLERARAQGVRHAEIFFDPQTHTQRGLDFDTVVRGSRGRGLKRDGLGSPRS